MRMQMGAIRDLYDKLLYGKYSELVRYGIFGVLNVVVTWVTYALFVLAGITPTISNALSWVIGVLVAFVCNKFWVFDSRSTESKTVGREFVSFLGGRVVTGVVAIIGFPILYSLGMNQSLMGVDGFPAKIVTSAVEIALNFVISKYLVFIKKKGQ